MLKSLNIKNYAIINELNIDFDAGFSVFTGETGAGKSIIIGAINYLLGGKADSSIIRSGQDKAIIEGIFDVEEYMKDILNGADIDYDNEIIVRRVISNDNRNSIKINQCSVTLQFLTELLNNSIDVHSQKDNQYLLTKKNHITLLDRYCENNDLLNEYLLKYIEFKNASNEYIALLNTTYNDSELEYYRFDYDELVDAKLDIDEENKLTEQEKRYKNSEKYINVLSDAINSYEGDGCIKDQLNSLYHNLGINDEQITSVKDNIENIYFNLNDEIDRLKDILLGINDEDLNIEYIEQRLYLYSKLKRKHSTDTEGLIKLIDEYKLKIAFFDDKDRVLKEKKDIVDKLKHEALQIANKLHEIRIDKAICLKKDIETQCEDLMLQNINFKVMFNEIDLNEHGIDDIEFYLSVNKGTDLKPLKNVASGGEMSRLMLALKTIFSHLSNCSTVIFDEIDTGVSGKVALAMGKKMRDISKDVQTISITHLAPVAACADYHFYIYKNNDSNTRVKRLKDKEIIEELASISSTETSENAIQAAEELYKLAQQ